MAQQLAVEAGSDVFLLKRVRYVDEEAVSIEESWVPVHLIHDVDAIGTPTTTRYVSAMSVAKGVVSLTGQESLNGLSVIMTPGWDNANGVTGWTRNCNIQNDSALQQACTDVFRFDNTN